MHFYLPNYSPKLSHIRDRFGFIKSGTKIYYFGVMNPVKNSVWEIIKSGHLYYDEPFFIVPNQFYKSAIETGEYNIGMVYISETNQTNWYLSDQKVIINNY